MMIWKIFLASVPFTLATDSSTYLRTEHEQAHRELPVNITGPCASAALSVEPDVTGMDLYELSAFDPAPNLIDVAINNGKPDKYFKIRACPGGIELTIDTCDNPSLIPPQDTFVSLWWRDKLDFKMIECHDHKIFNPLLPITCWWQERIYPGVEYYGEEVFIIVSNVFPSNSNIVFKYSVTNIATLDPGNAWPNCMESVTADYKKGSATANMDTGADPNFSLEFIYSGTMVPDKYRAVVFDDELCTQGHEIADSDGTINPTAYGAPPFTVVIIIIRVNGYIIIIIRLKANYPVWQPPLWTENDPSENYGTARFCVQFQVWKNDIAKMEFVDVAMKVIAERTQNCDSPDCYNTVHLIRDTVNTEERRIDPVTPIHCGHCENQNVTTVTQGESLNMCVKLMPVPSDATLEPGVCILEILKLNFITESPPENLGVIPTLHPKLLAGPQDCRLDGRTRCSVKITPPANFIQTLTPGDPNSIQYAMFTGKVLIGRGAVCSNRRMLSEKDNLEASDFEGQIVVTRGPNPCSYKRAIFCRIESLIQKLRARFQLRKK